MRNIWVYDLEQSINFHSCAAINIDTKERKFFVIAHFRNNFEEYIEWLKSKGLILVGYNNLDFDYQLLHILLLWKDGSNIDALIKALYERTQVIVDNSTHRFAKELIPEWKMLIPQLDVYKINHLDNEAKRTSWTKNLAMYKPIKLTGIPLESFILSIDSNILCGENNYLGIVKNKRIGQSAAKYLNKIKVQRLPEMGNLVM